MAGRTFGDPTVTGSVSRSNGMGDTSQPMPSSLGASTQVAESRFLPPENVGGGGAGGNSSGFANTSGGFNSQTNTLPPFAGDSSSNSVVTQDLPTLSSTSPGTQTAMPAQPQSLPPLSSPPSQLPVNSNVPTGPNLSVVPPANAFTHTIQSGESLYTIARRYNVTTQAIVQANGMSSPDKIVVGQSVIIPGMKKAGESVPTQVATASLGPSAMPSRPAALTPVSGDGTLRPNGQSASKPLDQPTAPKAETPQATAPQKQPEQPVQQPARQPQQLANVQQPKQAAAPKAQMPLEEPAASGDKFRWPVSGRVITDFATSKGTGINIEVQEGSSVKATENGTVIYVGNGVEGYGNMILIRHANGYVSAYAHLKESRIDKGATVKRGDTIGAAGMTGSVNKPQLHFELRKGATPVDPMPLLAS